MLCGIEIAAVDTIGNKPNRTVHHPAVDAARMVRHRAADNVTAAPADMVLGPNCGATNGIRGKAGRHTIAQRTSFEPD